MKNLWSDSVPLMMEMLLDLNGLIFILANEMFSQSFSGGRLAHGTVVVRVVMSSITALVGVRVTPDFNGFQPNTHLEAWSIKYATN